MTLDRAVYVVYSGFDRSHSRLTAWEDGKEILILSSQRILMQTARKTMFALVAVLAVLIVVLPVQSSPRVLPSLQATPTPIYNCQTWFSELLPFYGFSDTNIIRWNVADVDLRNTDVTISGTGDTNFYWYVNVDYRFTTAIPSGGVYTTHLDGGAGPYSQNYHTTSDFSAIDYSGWQILGDESFSFEACGNIALPAATSTPTVTLTPSDTPEPTITPSPTITLTPTDTPEPTATGMVFVTPTAEPGPTMTPTPTDSERLAVIAEDLHQTQLWLLFVGVASLGLLVLIFARFRQ